MIVRRSLLKRLLFLSAASGGQQKTNLLDPSLIEEGYYTSSGNKTQDGDDRYRRFAITLPAGSYAFGTDLPNCYIIRVLIDNVADGSGGATQERPFTLTEESEVKFSFRNTSTTSITDPFNAWIYATD